MEQIKQKKIEAFEVVCPYCNKVLQSTSWNQLNHNYEVHSLSCKKRIIKNE